MSDLLNRLGIIKVSDDLIRENPEGALEIFKDILVTDVKFELVRSGYIFHYRGVSKHFDLIKEGEPIPFYDAIIKCENGKIISYAFKRVDAKCLT